MDIVKCHSGGEYAERPLALYWSNEWLEIEAVEQQWRTPKGKHFRVRVARGAVFELKYDELAGEWRVDSVNG
ncbi:MAG: hypothetical protein AAB342_01605 [Chloroflexota bacterium]